MHAHALTQAPSIITRQWSLFLDCLHTRTLKTKTAGLKMGPCHSLLGVNLLCPQSCFSSFPLLLLSPCFDCSLDLVLSPPRSIKEDSSASFSRPAAWSTDNTRPELRLRKWGFEDVAAAKKLWGRRKADRAMFSINELRKCLLDNVPKNSYVVFLPKISQSSSGKMKILHENGACKIVLAHDEDLVGVLLLRCSGRVVLGDADNL